MIGRTAVESEEVLHLDAVGWFGRMIGFGTGTHAGAWAGVPVPDRASAPRRSMGAVGDTAAGETSERRAVTIPAPVHEAPLPHDPRRWPMSWAQPCWRAPRARP